MKPRHSWKDTESMCFGDVVQRCDNCGTERVRDPSTKSLYLFRRGRAVPPNRKPMPEDWTGYKAGVAPKCLGPGTT